MAKTKKKLIVVIPMPGIYLLDVAGPADVFAAADKQLDGKGGYEIMLASPVNTKRISTKSGVDLHCAATVADITQPVDTVIIAGFSMPLLENGARFFQWLHDFYPKVNRICSICVGAYALAEAGLLNGKQATTHWEYSQQFQQRYPSIKVDTDPFFTRDTNIYTSGGVTSGIDLALALVEEDHGRELALQVARKLILPLKRPGFQAQFSRLLEVHRLENSIGGKLYPWMIRHLKEDLSIEHLAQHSNMSVRNFTRVFLKETGVTPAKFVEKVRVEVARRYLEDSDLSIDQIAEKCGLGGLISLRRTFLRHMNMSPSDYRRSFRTSLQEIEN
ncbi:GlxA family transcriptional regulator [Pseudoflavitalea sp. G-6-1-2]|uniref:GlxA family transcriptional regulator n=1 Tax=Pseudoflavitalea sp. G-6-1-2 TaxID=2728841 RepID=UPI00146BFE3D|nr:GlxA family transcriptional regulator [Pseudoflavitalea sp. G-6-1-2]NML21172.1 GlxA family transcriptional regulator [Pseudoflavitalea sp. G-6-1-2]